MDMGVVAAIGGGCAAFLLLSGLAIFCWGRHKGFWCKKRHPPPKSAQASISDSRAQFRSLDRLSGVSSGTFEQASEGSGTPQATPGNKKDGKRKTLLLPDVKLKSALKNPTTPPEPPTRKPRPRKRPPDPMPPPHGRSRPSMRHSRWDANSRQERPNGRPSRMDAQRESKQHYRPKTAGKPVEVPGPALERQHSSGWAMFSQMLWNRAPVPAPPPVSSPVPVAANPGTTSGVERPTDIDPTSGTLQPVVPVAPPPLIAVPSMQPLAAAPVPRTPHGAPFVASPHGRKPRQDGNPRQKHTPGRPPQRAAAAGHQGSPPRGRVPRKSRKLP